MPKTIQYCNMVMNQSQLMQTFIEDLLDLKLMREGIFSLHLMPFNPNETFELVKNIFDPQAKAKKIGLKVSIE